MAYTIYDVLYMFTNDDFMVEIYDDKHDEVIGEWWAFDLPKVFEDYTVDSIDPPSKSLWNSEPKIGLNSPDLTIEEIKRLFRDGDIDIEDVKNNYNASSYFSFNYFH